MFVEKKNMAFVCCILLLVIRVKMEGETIEIQLKTDRFKTSTNAFVKLIIKKTI